MAEYKLLVDQTGGGNTATTVSDAAPLPVYTTAPHASGTELVSGKNTSTGSTAWNNSAGAYYIVGDNTSGAWSVTGYIQGCMTSSSDDDLWVNQASFTLSGTGPTDEDSAIAVVYAETNMPYGRILPTLTGTGANVTVTR